MTLDRRILLKTSAAAAATLGCSRIAVGQTREPIRIGVITSLTGPGAPASRNVKLGMDIVAAQINKAGGIGGRPVALEVRDDKGNVAQAIAMARELLGSGINLCAGTSQSAIALAMGPVMQAENSVMVGSIAASDKIAPDDLQRDAADRRSLRKRRPIVDRSHRQQPPGLTRIMALPGSGTKPGCIVLGTQRDRNGGNLLVTAPNQITGASAKPSESGTAILGITSSNSHPGRLRHHRASVQSTIRTTDQL